jgi:hypothetical protein
VYILVLTVFVICLYIFFLRQKWFVATFISFIIIFLVNFVLVGVMIVISDNDEENVDVRGSGSGLSEFEKGTIRDLDTYIYRPKPYCMFFASLCLVGTTSVFLYRVPEILTESIHSGVNWHAYYTTIILTQTLSAIIFGLASYFTRRTVNEYYFGIIGALIAIFGFLLFIISEYATNLSFIGTILISIASGIGWVIFPLIAYDDAGPKPFGPVLSMILLANYWGMFIFRFIFVYLMENFTKSLILIYVIYIIGCVGTIFACLVGRSIDD